MLAGTGVNDLERGIAGEPGSVRTIRRERFIDIRNAENSRCNVEIFSLDAPGISRSIELLVMQCCRARESRERTDPLKNFPRVKRMPLHFSAFFGRHRPGLVENARRHA